MGRKKKNSAALGIKTSKETAAAFRDQRSPPEPYSPILLSPERSPPRVPYNEYRQGLDPHTRAADHAESVQFADDDGELGSVAAPNDHEDEERDFSLRGRIREKWTKVGYYEHHPNHNAGNASEAQLKDMLQGHEKLGPMLKEYKILLNHSKKHTLLLQYPNREFGQEYRAATGQKPLELRIKPKCGLVELDIPLNIHHNFDKEKGIQYGDAMRNSHLLQQGGSHGLAGGFGVGPRPAKDDRRAPLPEGPPLEKLLEDIDDSNNKGHVMNKITLGGRIVPFKDGDPIYMTATFRGG